ncbi:outer membrane lipoprotein carrier protein LolA [Jejubacter calystegiae]|uniref:Outer membrane lipoprotein carrier protein LolA n=1 Tax=Jejubacter calystegiae TaxID=2579935 RepID=A0A4P8YJJ2_9ENTR|nr:outer membrane lipoprotein carrier protein LolA [Jejubacter calystegiae]QCT20915.1 outer membrane lipoprotein carrier protein LolA [Jejubacter calystegiae]
MKKVMMMLALLLCSAAAQAITLDELHQRFAQQPVVRAKFEQQRQIKDMGQPLWSSGELLIARDKGLWWHQQRPFPMTLVLDDSHMVQAMGNQVPQVITAASNPQMFQFNHLLRALFEADRKTLEENFTSRLSDKGNGAWRLVLIPKAAPLNQIFNSITLDGDRFLQKIILDDKQGDTTGITFSDHQTEPRTLTDAEQQRFDF